MVIPLRREPKTKVRPFYPARKFKIDPKVELEYVFFNRGHRRTLIFINGMGMGLSGFKNQMGSQEEVVLPNYNLLFFNYRGHPRISLGDSTPFTYFRDCAKDLKELLNHLGIKKEIVLVPHSMGALICAEFYARFINLVDGIAMVSPVVGNPLRTFPISTVQKQWELLKPLITDESLLNILLTALRTNKNPVSMRLEHMMFKFLFRSSIDYKTFRKIAKLVLDADPHNVLFQLRSMILTGEYTARKMLWFKCPVLAFAGSRDFIVHPSSMKVLSERLPDAEIVVLQNSTHMPSSEVPFEFNNKLEGFLAELDSV